jgi:hypothetical protein
VEILKEEMIEVEIEEVAIEEVVEIAAAVQTVVVLEEEDNNKFKSKSVWLGLITHQHIIEIAN